MVTLDEVKQHLERYREQVRKTGAQLGWEYEEAAFPYSVESKPEGEGKWFYLKGTNPLYRYIVVGVGTKDASDGGNERCYIQITLPDTCTHGDKSKANELCKWLGRHLRSEVHLFNGRVMYFNPRK